MSLGGKAGGKGAAKGTAQGKQAERQGKQSSDKSLRSSKANDKADDNDEVSIKRNVLTLMETTCRTEEEVCSALHYCDNDLDRACEMLLETNQNQGWQTNEKKKKKNTNCVAPNSTGPPTEVEDWAASPDKTNAGNQQNSGPTGNVNTRDHRSSSRGRPSNRPYRGHMNNSVGNDEGEGIPRGAGSRRGPMGRGGGRGGGRGSSRGGRGSRPPRGQRHLHRSDETWNLSSNMQDSQIDGYGDQFPPTDEWEYEEWTGSLADTKVFTPSTSLTETTVNANDITAIPQNSDQTILHNSNLNSLQQNSSIDYSKQNNSGLVGETTSSPPPSMSSSMMPQDPAIYAYTNSSHHLPKSQSPVVMNVSERTLSAAQSQYFSQLPQLSEAKPQNMLNPQVYGTNYSVYGSDINQRKPVQRARVPPPSKIPASAVEMPGDLGSSSIGMLDVQFGALDFGSDTSPFLNDGVSSSASNSISNEKYITTSSSLDHNLSDSNNVTVSSQQSMDHQSAASSLSNDVSAYSRSAQLLTSDSLATSVSGDQNVSGSASQYGTGVSRTVTSESTQHVPQLTTVTGLENQLTGKSSNNSTMSSQQSYSSYPGQTAAYEVSQQPKPTYHTHHGYPYNQVNSNATAFTAASSIASASAYPTNTLNQYQQVFTQPLNTYQNSSVYGSGGLYTNQYTNYQTLQNNSNKISSNAKESQYDTVTTSNLSISQSTPSTQAPSKTSSSSGKTNSSSSSVISSGTATSAHVNPVMGQFLMGQPYYAQQAPMPYSFEEVQMMQQRLPHHMQYYEMGYGSGGGGAAASARDAPLSSFSGSLAAGTAEARFGRTEAPSPQAVASGGAGAGAPQPPQTALTPYAAHYAFYGASMLPGSFPTYSTQPIYPMATAGGTGSSTYGGGKSVGGAGPYVGGTASVVGSYGTPAAAAAPPPQAYDTVQQQPSQINSHQQDYKSSGGYNSSQQSSGVKQGVSNSNATTADMNNSMYGGKGHVSLGKVNSYDKAYHSGTPPPPFGIGATAAGVGASGYATPLYIHHPAMPPPPQHQMDGRVSSNHRRDNGSNNSRGGSTGQSKQAGGAKQGYSQSYWTQN